MLGLTAEQLGTILLAIALLITGRLGGQKGKEIVQGGSRKPMPENVMEVAGAIVSDKAVDVMVRSMDALTASNITMTHTVDKDVAAKTLLTAMTEKDVAAKVRLTEVIERNIRLNDELRDEIKEVGDKMDRLKDELIRGQK